MMFRVQPAIIDTKGLTVNPVLRCLHGEAVRSVAYCSEVRNCLGSNYIGWVNFGAYMDLCLVDHSKHKTYILSRVSD
jgi:hypothetical protein